MPRNGRTERVLRALAQSPQPLSAPDLLDLLGGAPADHQRALTAYGQMLREHARHGRVSRAGRTAGAWQQGPAVLWRITESGRAWLAVQEAGPALARRKAAREAVRREEKTAALASARAAYGRATPRTERRLAAARLRESGCTLAEIGAVFGVGREMVRQDLLQDPDANPLRTRRTPQAGWRTALAEAIVTEILAGVCEPCDQCRDRFCPDCTRYRQAQADAEIVRRIAATFRAGQEQPVSVE